MSLIIGWALVAFGSGMAHGILSEARQNPNSNALPAAIVIALVGVFVVVVELASRA